MLDLEKLLAPIREDAPCGDDLRLRPSDTTFRTISDARTEIPVEDDPNGQGRAADWVLVRRTGEQTLADESKDLEIAAWLTEALARTEGFEGLCEGLQLVRELLRAFWPKLHPGVDEEDGEITLPIRARPLTWMGSSRDFLRAVGTCPIVNSADGRVLAWQDYKNSELVDEKKSLADPTAYNEMIEAGYISGEEWKSRLASVDVGTLGHVLDVVRQCEGALTELRSTCDELFEEDEPSFVGLGELLLEVREYLEGHVPSEGAESGPGEAAPGVATEAGAGVAGPGAPAGPIASRSEALRRLSEVADYFQRTEPHSPISHLIQRTVRWGHMPLPALLEEIVQDEGVLERIWDTLGIKRGDDGSSYGGEDGE